MKMNSLSPQVIRRMLSVCLTVLSMSLSLPAVSGGLQFEYKATITATANELAGTLELLLSAGEPIYNTRIVIWSADQTTRMAGPQTWKPHESHDFQLQISSRHPLPGNYNLLLAIEYQDNDKEWHGYPLAIEYVQGTARETPLRTPQVIFKGDQLRWQTAGIAPEDLSLTLALSPVWETIGSLTSEDHAFDLAQQPDRNALPGGIYPQLARLVWSNQGFHYSKLIPWSIRMDQRGQWLKYTGNVPQNGWWRSPQWLQIFSITLAGLALL